MADGSIRIVRGTPTAEELAALIAALSSGPPPPQAGPARSRWADPARTFAIVHEWGRWQP